MKNFLKNISWGSIVCMILGIALVIHPSLLTETLNYIFGALIVIGGTIGVVKFFVSSTDRDFFAFIGDVAILILGCIIIANKTLLETLVMIAVGLYLLSSGIPKLIYSLKAKKMGYQDWKFPLISSCLTVALGLFIIASPALLHGVMRLFGFILAAGGGIHFASGISMSKIMDEINDKKVDRKGRKAPVPDGEIIDVDNFDVK